MEDPPVLRDAFAGVVGACSSCFRKRHQLETTNAPVEHRDLRISADDQVSPAAVLRDDLCRSHSRQRLALTPTQRRDAQTHARNLLLIIGGILPVLIVLFGLQSLESSLNSAGGLGEICLALVYGLGVLSATFLSPILQRRLGPPMVLRLCVVPLTLFVASHYKVFPATFLSSCALLGMVFTMLLSTVSVMATSAGINYATIYGVSHARMVTHFSSILFVGLGPSYCFGPLIVSLTIHNPDDFSGGSATSGQAVACQDDERKLVISEKDRDILLSVFLLLLLLAFTVLCFVRSASSTAIKAKLASASAWQQITATVRLVADFDMLLMIPWIFFTGMTKEMITANFTKFYISSCLGIANVGYAVASFGIGSTLTSAFMSPLLKRTNRPVAAGMVVAVEVGVIVVLLLWERTPNAALLYGLSGIWGAGDGIWNVLLSVVLGVVFPTQQEAAFSNHRGWQGLGFAFSAVYSQRFGSCLDQLKIKFMLMLGLLFLSMILYTVLEWRIRKFGRERQRSNEITDMEPLQTWTSKEELCMTSL